MRGAMLTEVGLMSLERSCVIYGIIRIIKYNATTHISRGIRPDTSILLELMW